MSECERERMLYNNKGEFLFYEKYQWPNLYYYISQLPIILYCYIELYKIICKTNQKKNITIEYNHLLHVKVIIFVITVLQIFTSIF